jgi:hypothetical protein
MAKIARADNQAMNILMKGELARKGHKLAADGDNGDIQAFKDHEEYNKTLEEVLKEDKTEQWSPNDMILD